MSTVFLRLALAFFVSATVACGGAADPGETTKDAADPDASSDAHVDADGSTIPIDTGTCPDTPPVSGGTCGPAAAGGVVCKSAPRCQICDPRGKYWIEIDDCTCKTDRWECHPTAVDCFGSATPGLYSDPACTVPYHAPDAGPDVGEASTDADATDDGG